MTTSTQLSARHAPWPSLLLLAGLTAGLATMFGTSATELKSVAAQAAAAVLTAGLVLAVVPLALVRVGGRTGRLAQTSSDRELLVINLALVSAGAASVHFSVITKHFNEWWGFGTFFVIAAIAQLTWALLAVKHPSRALFAVGATGNLFIIVTWALAHTSGLPFGPEPWRAEKIGLADIVTTALEALLVAGTSLFALRPQTFSERRGGASARIAWLIACATLVVVALALLSAVGAASSVIPSAG